MRVCSPPAMAGQPLAWAAVGAPKVVENHARTAGENGSSGSGELTRSTLPAGCDADPGTGR